MHLSSYFQWDFTQSSWDRLNILMAVAHITWQLLTTSFNDQHERKHSILHFKHSGWGHVDYVRASRHTTPPGPGFKTGTAFYKFSDIKCQCSKTSELLREKEKERQHNSLLPPACEYVLCIHVYYLYRFHAERTHSATTYSSRESLIDQINFVFILLQQTK